MHQRGRRGGTRDDADPAVENTTHSNASALEQRYRLVKSGEHERGKYDSGRDAASPRNERKQAPPKERFFCDGAKRDCQSQKLQMYLGGYGGVGWLHKQAYRPPPHDASEQCAKQKAARWQRPTQGAPDSAPAANLQCNVECQQHPHQDKCLEQRRLLSELTGTKDVKRDGKLKQSPQRNDNNQKDTDVRIVPGTSAAGI